MTTSTTVRSRALALFSGCLLALMLAAAPTPAAHAAETYYTNTNGVPVYDSKTDGNVIATLNASTAVQAEPYGTRYPISTASGLSGYVDATWLTRAAGSTDLPAAGVTNTGGVPLYLGPGTGWALYEIVPEGTPIQVGTTHPNYDNTFVEANYQGRLVYLDERWIMRMPQYNNPAHVNTGGVPVYAGPNAGFNRIGTLAAPAVVASSMPALYRPWEMIDGYARVAFGAYGGWVDETWLTTGVSIGSGMSYQPATVYTTEELTIYLGPGTGFYPAQVVPAGTELHTNTGHLFFPPDDGWLLIDHGEAGAYVDYAKLCNTGSDNPC